MLTLFDHGLRALRSYRNHQQIGRFLSGLCVRETTERLSELGFEGREIGIIHQTSDDVLAPLHQLCRVTDVFSIQKDCSDAEIVAAPRLDFDALVGVMGFHWVNDLPGILTQCRMALGSGGLFTAAFIGGRSLNELRFALQLAESEITGGAHGRVSPFLDIRDAGMLMARAGFSEPVVDAATFNCTYSSPMALMHDLRSMNEGNALVSSARQPLRRDVLFEACRVYQDIYPAVDGRIQATFELICLTGWAPDRPK